jgi:hypothetical protein
LPAVPFGIVTTVPTILAAAHFLHSGHFVVMIPTSDLLSIVDNRQITNYRLRVDIPKTGIAH